MRGQSQAGDDQVARVFVGCVAGGVLREDVCVERAN